MKCPVCQQEMSVWKTDTSHNSKTGQLYDRTLYHCTQDDTWAKTEIPKSSKTLPNVVAAR
ncbi:hypothetical protein [Dictyobacter arantiisoli]|uniref:Zinc finger Ogr/Delta-type domain-containing protein n=1 Tax=Dictyobacter arantiisoli TaxID=2014874 RepID=A0A5A5TK94_9CHLR|nr:hypothetical protein [Dictyobacter arantiisoli]GCF11675.1 hypothetical protein KDI_52390 [Dictyobacter arantiisoli]